MSTWVTRVPGGAPAGGWAAVTAAATGRSTPAGVCRTAVEGCSKRDPVDQVVTDADPADGSA